MSIKPILFNTDMVQAILDGRKTVTRRLGSWKIESYSEDNGDIKAKIVQQTKRSKTTCQYYGCKEDLYEEHAPYQPGDILYVRETWGNWSYDDPESNAVYYQYRADYPNGAKKYMFDDKHECDLPKWHPSIHMPKEAARIWLKVTNVRVERLQDMNVDDVIKEGVFNDDDWKYQGSMRAKLAFELWEDTWNSTIKKSEIDSYGQDANPWVWAISFERCKKPQEVNH